MMDYHFLGAISPWAAIGYLILFGMCVLLYVRKREKDEDE